MQINPVRSPDLGFQPLTGELGTLEMHSMSVGSPDQAVNESLNYSGGNALNCTINTNHFVTKNPLRTAQLLFHFLVVRPLLGFLTYERWGKSSGIFCDDHSRCLEF